MLRYPHTFPALTFLASLLFVASPTLEAQSGRKLGKEEKIDQYGYGIRVIERWTSVPQQPGETRIIGSWQPDQKDLMLRGDYSAMGCELKVVRFVSTGVETGTEEEKAKAREEREKKKREAEEAEKDPQKRLASLLKGVQPENLEEWIEEEYEGARKRAKPATIKAGRGSRKLQGELLEFTKGRNYVIMALFKEPDYEWGVIYEAPEEHFEKEWKKLYETSLKSFRVFEAKGEVYSVSSDVDTSKLPPDQKREVIKAGIAGNPGWWAYDTENYVFLTNSEKKGFIRELGRDIETLRSKVYENLFPPTDKVDAICIVRVFSDQSEYHQYGGPYGSAGYWNSSKEELVLFDNFEDVSAARSTDYTKSVMYHEAFHQYIYYAVGDLAPHSWFNEGHGDFFAGMKIRGGSVSNQKFDWRVGTLKRHLSEGKGLIPLRSLVRLPQSEYYSNAGLKYAQGWALVYYLREVASKKEWREIPDKYFAYLRDNIAAFKKSKGETDDSSGEPVEGIPGVKIYSFDDSKKVEEILEAAVDKGFEGIDYEELQVAYERWISGL